MNTKFRPAMIACAVVAAVAAVATGLMTLRGETREASVDTVCARAAWPAIPAKCLDGGSGRVVRTVGVDGAAEAVSAVPDAQVAIQERFDTAFQ